MSGAIEPPGQWAIPSGKILDYLLCIEHAEGGSKARFFLSFGFSATDPDLFAQALFDHAVPQHLQRIRKTPWGTKFIFEGCLPTPDGRNPFVRSIWQTSLGSGETASLVTVYPP